MTGVICLTLHLTRVGFQNLPFPSVSAMSSASLDVLRYRIPARMRELESFVRLGVALESNPPTSDIAVKIGDSSYSTTDHRFLLHPLADAAAIISRGLLNFLGLSSQNGSLIAKPLTRKDDLKMSDIGLDWVSVLSATSGWPFPPGDAEVKLMLCLRCADKVSAHLTHQSAVSNNLNIASLVDAADFVNQLINREVYVALGLPPVNFGHGSAHGLISVSQS